MARRQPANEVMTREALIAALRAELLNRADGRSICSLAAEEGIFCGGYRRFSDAQLRRRFPWIAAKRPAPDRAAMEELGDAFIVARQEVRDAPTACDVEGQEHDLCNGWDDFSNDALAGFYRELTGTIVTLTPISVTG